MIIPMLPFGLSHTTVTRGHTPWPPATIPSTAILTARRDREDYRNRRLFVGKAGGKSWCCSPTTSGRSLSGADFLSRDGQIGVNCAPFRNEGAYCGEVKSSRLILSAEVWAWARWPGERLYTYVDARRVRSTTRASATWRPGGGSAG